MRQIRPTIEELKKRYSRAMAQRKMTERRHAQRPSLATAPKIPDNSEPWPPHPPRTLAECMWISDQVGRFIEHQRKRLPVCNFAEAQTLLLRYCNHESLQFARQNPRRDVREHALTHLAELEFEGDPYSRDILEEWRKENSGL